MYGWCKGVCKKWKRTGDSDTNNTNLHPGYRNGIWHWKCTMLIMKSGKKQTAVLGNIGSWHHQTSRDEGKINKKRVSQTNEKDSQNQALLQKSHQRDKHLGSPPCKILGTIPKMDKGRTQTNGPKDKKVDDYALLLRDNIDWLYVSRKGGLATIEDYVVSIKTRTQRLR